MVKISMKCLDCNTVNFFMGNDEREDRKCRVCGGKLKAFTVDMKEDGEEGGAASMTPPEPVFLDILRVVIEKNCASMSMIQRLCAVGYNCAGRAMDWMEANGYVSKYEGQTPRKVLITKEQFEQIYGAFEPKSEAPQPSVTPAEEESAEAVEAVDPLDVREELMPAYVEALRGVVRTGNCSVSLIQRKCNYGYNFSWRILNWMEASGYVAAFDGGKLRKVLITKEQFEEKYGPLDSEN